MKRLNNISVCRIVLFVIFSIYFNNPYLYVAIGIVLCFYRFKESLIYTALILLIILTNSINIDYIPYGIIEKKQNNYFIVDKILYKTQIENDSLKIGDIIYTNNGTCISSIDKLKKNIKFENTEYKLLYNLKIRYFISNKINSFEDNIKIGLDKFIYNINNYDDISFNLGYGLSIYYLLKAIIKKNKKVGIAVLLIYSILFYFDPKFYLIIIDLLIDNSKTYKLWVKLLIIAILNKCLFYNYSIIIPLLFSLRNYIDINLNFYGYLIIIESILFGYVNLISIFLFKYLIYVQIGLILFSFLVLFMPNLAPIYECVLGIYSLFNDLSFEIRGSITIFGFILYFLIKSRLKSDSELIKTVLVIIVILSPFNNPLLNVSFIDVGQGDSELIKLPFYRGTVLIDTGSKYNYYKLKKYLLSKGIYSIDYLIITHNDSDHNGNLDSLSKDFEIKEIITTGKDIKLDNLSLKYLYITDFDNDNDNSLVYWININGISYLFTGDISSKAERKLINKYGQLDVDVLKASHHGSYTGNSKYLIANCLPKIAIISTSGMYGHPAVQTLNNLDEYLVDYYITKNSGNIEFYMTGLFNVLKTDIGEFAIIR